MALRILSGMLDITNGERSGSVTISFLPFTVTNGAPGVSLTKERIVGPPGPYVNPPAFIVAARQFRLIDVSGASDFRIRIDDVVTATDVTVTWSGQQASFSEEIPFLIIGEVSISFLDSLRRWFGQS